LKLTIIDQGVLVQASKNSGWPLYGGIYQEQYSL